MTELIFLNFFLLVAFVLAPLMTAKFFLSGSKDYSDCHKISLVILLAGLLLNLNYVVVVWPLFCAFGFFLFLKIEYKSISFKKSLAGCIPFLFSLVSSVWFVAGVNDLYLLGYNQTWSFYAALHGSFLGWIFVGCLAYLTRRTDSNKFYLWGCYLSFVFFLLIAFGIDGIPFIKRVGVTGFSALIPLMIGIYIFELKKNRRLSLILSGLSLFFITVSMSLAILNEFWTSFPRVAFGIPTMVLTHGFINAVLVVPCFFLAIYFERDEVVSKTIPKNAVIFLDGLCVLCNGTVALLIKLDKNRKFKYSSLQGVLAQATLEARYVQSVDGVIFWDEGIFYQRAEAVIHILIKLGGIYKFTGISLKIFPLVILNGLYNIIARTRYRFFGKNNVCQMPSAEIKNLFIP